jgi:hypothetical protein
MHFFTHGNTKPDLLHFNKTYYNPNNSITMGCPISGLTKEIYLQHFEENTIKHWKEIGEIIYYDRYVDDILTVFNNERINVNQICMYLNILNKQLETEST